MLRFCYVIFLACSPLALNAAPAGRVQVIDGDTWKVGGHKVRIFGIDAPEADQNCQRSTGEVWACGKWVTAEVKARFEGTSVKCKKLDTDRYGRTVARCHSGDLDVGRVMVSEGLAFAYRRYSMDYDLDEKSAAVNDRGLHASRVQNPAEFRAARLKDPQPSRDGCPIKGNISSKGVRIYHMPGQEHYTRTRISTAKGEKWFCSEKDAQTAGWRRARR